MSDLTHIVTKYARSETTLLETAQTLASLHLLASETNQSFVEGTWSEVEKLLNDGVLSFTQYRALDREYRNAKTEARKFVILGLDYGYIQE